MPIASIIRLALLVSMLALLQACSLFHAERTLPETETLPVAELYEQAHQYLIDGDYNRAEQYYKRLTARFPFGPFSQQAELDLSYVQYKGNKPDDAYSTINRFIRTYPAQRHIDYAYYLRGLINFNRDVGLMDRWFGGNAYSRRDPSYIQRSFNDFSEMVQRYPDSRYADDARQRMIYLRNLLAQHELNVAMYYLRRDACVGAAGRGKYIIEHYQTSPQTADALAIMAKCYSALGEPDLATKARDVLELNYPEHPWLTDPDWPNFPSTLWRLLPFSSRS